MCERMTAAIWPVPMDGCSCVCGCLTVVDAVPVRCVVSFMHCWYENCSVVPRAVITEVLLDLPPTHKHTTAGQQSDERIVLY